MDKNQFKDVQAHLGCGSKQLAAWIGVSPVTVARWRNGTSPVPASAVALLAALKTGWRP
jgi:DNA-binding transcriptional regulator YdaS (Cro superfamily)